MTHLQNYQHQFIETIKNKGIKSLNKKFSVLFELDSKN